MTGRASLPYLIAGTVACVIVAGGIVFVRHSRGLLQARLEAARRQLGVEEEQGRLPPEWQGGDLENLHSGDVGLKVPDGDMTRIAVAELLATFWYVFVPMVLATCLGTAALCSRESVGRNEPVDTTTSTPEP